MDILYRKNINLYSNSFLIEYNRVLKLTKKLNEKIGFPIYKVSIDVINSELIVVNRFSNKRKKRDFRHLMKRNLNYGKW